MNLRKRDFFLFILSCAVLPAWAVRDPFWPIGYEPPKPKMPETATTDAVPQKKLPPKVVTPVIKPITEEDWGKASKTLIINGFTQSVRPDTGETRTQVMINRRTYAPGATLSITNADIHFTWRIESLADRDLKLKQIKAARIITDRSSNLNQ